MVLSRTEALQPPTTVSREQTHPSSTQSLLFTFSFINYMSHSQRAPD